MVQIGSMSYFQDHKWYDKLMDGKLKDETLTLKTKVEKSWGDATPGVMKFCIWLTNSFENFHELDHNVLTRDPYLGTNQIFGASNVGSTQENQGYDEHMGNETPKQSVCKIRRFEMMKYSFSDNEEYITIKESDHLNHSKKGLNAYRELLKLTNEGQWTLDLGLVISLEDLINNNYGVTCEEEAKRRNSGAKTKTFEEYYFLHLYAVSSNKDNGLSAQLQAQETRNDLFLIWRSNYNQYALQGN
ncbi:hypothetical protein Tco_0240652 [Tanacetum coccineum]